LFGSQRDLMSVQVVETQFVEQGFLHILDGVDHLLFILCLVIPLRRFRTLALIVTAFTTWTALSKPGRGGLWIGAVPVLLALLWQVYENLAVLLPNTL